MTRSLVACARFETLFKRIVRAALPIGFVAGCGTAGVGTLGDVGHVDGSGGVEDAASYDAALRDAALTDAEVPDARQCGGVYKIVGLDGSVFPDTGNLFTYCQMVCQGTSFCEPENDPSGNPGVGCRTDCTGRRPAGLAEAQIGGSSALGRLFGRMAHLEAASIPAFEQLAAELEAHRAPRALVEGALRARADEVRHTRMTAGMARRFGGRFVAPKVEVPSVRTLEAMALENAVEGCVRETFGALVAAWQARASRDAKVAHMMAGIAADEARHGELAWNVYAWTDGQLSATSRRHTREAMTAALEELTRTRDDNSGASADPALQAAAGLPSAAAEHALGAAFQDAARV